MNEYEEFDDPYSRLVLHKNACFLCGADLSQSRTKEHVFPRWLQRRHTLWDEQLGLLNNTHIPYRQLRVPCCATCNNDHLSALEQEVSEAVATGYAACAELDELTVFQWLGKIFFGVLRKELALLVNRGDATQGTIVPSKLVQSFNTLHAFLQSIRQPVQFPGGNPFSVLVANLHDLGEGRNYFFRDNIHLSAASLRTKDVGFIVAFEDLGINRNTYGNYIKAVNGRKLHPVQFDELYAKVIYQVYRLNSSPRYMTATSSSPEQPIIVHTMPLAGYTVPPAMVDWNQEEFANFLIPTVAHWLQLFDIDPETVFVPPNLVKTWMSDEQNNLSLFDAAGSPLPPDSNSHDI